MTGISLRSAVGGVLLALVATPFLLLRAQAAPHAHGATAPSVPPAASADVPLLGNLGNWHRTIITSQPLAQRYFDQGLRLYYAFNHAEALRAFREAQRLDPACLMCVWGEAVTLGPNVNAPMDTSAERQAVTAATRALAMLTNTGVGATSVDATRDAGREQAFVRAIGARYVGRPGAARAARDSAYAMAMAVIADSAPGDADALALAAEAVMDLSPWNYWTADGTPRPGTARALAWLERGMRAQPDHPGACHFYIHAVEAEHPRRAIRCAERLAALMPGAGHIVHMPAHIYIRVGRWADAIEVNRHAVHADVQYFDGPHTPDALFYAAAYQSHNHHFLALASVMAGASASAIEASREVVEIVTPELAAVVPAVEPMLAIPVQTLVTFGKWDEVLRTPLPPSTLRVALSHFWYARGIAFAATARMSEARATADSIRAALRDMPDGEPRLTLQIAALAVDGEIALRSRNPAAAVRAFTTATQLEDRLAYMEPPTWFYPVRHSLGKALLAASKPHEAEAVYATDLRRFPENVWSLRGLAQSLKAQGRMRDALDVERRFEKAMRLADVRVTSSRF